MFVIVLEFKKEIKEVMSFGNKYVIVRDCLRHVKRTFGIRESNFVGFLLLPHERRLLHNLSDGAFHPMSFSYDS